MPRLNLEFISSFVNVNDMPITDSEIALVGRSNVGKSSLINALAHRKQLARTSKTPGATKLINAYGIQTSTRQTSTSQTRTTTHHARARQASTTHTSTHHTRRWIVDLPGYGFAATSKSQKQQWAQMAERYLCERASLRSVMLLIDGEIGPTRLDIQMQNWLHSIGLPLSFIATKVDKVNRSRFSHRSGEIAAKLKTSTDDIFWTSSSKRIGMEALRQQMLSILEAEA